jgi:hypothetical protein
MSQPQFRIAGVKTLHRKFMVSDAMVLIGATAIGLGWTRATFNGTWFELTQPGTFFNPPSISQALYTWSDLITPCLTIWTIALTLLWLRQPRGTVRKLSRYPGALACAAVTASIITSVTFKLLFYLMISSMPVGRHAEWFYWLPGLFSSIEGDLSQYGRPRGEAIAVCWTILWISGRWRAQATWLDRLGRLVAVIWFIITVSHYWFALGDPSRPFHP